MEEHKVFVTGIGVVGPKFTNAQEFHQLLLKGESSIDYLEDSKLGGLSCWIGGKACINKNHYASLFKHYDISKTSDYIQLACHAGLEAWENAGLSIPNFEESTVDWDTGIIVGTGFSGLDFFGKKVVPLVNSQKIRKIGSLAIPNIMGSGAAAYLGSVLAVGNKVSANSSACCTGLEAIIEGYERIKHGYAQRMIVGGTEGYTNYIWSMFDAARVLNNKMNDTPSQASRPMSISARGLVPASGAGVLILESEASALRRKARIYAEVLSGTVNSGGLRNGGSMTFPNKEGVIRCIEETIAKSKIEKKDIQLINGHLTGTKADPIEIENWSNIFKSTEHTFPYIQSTKSIIGHTLGAAGGLETVACILQLNNQFIHPSINCEDVHPLISQKIPINKIPNRTIKGEKLSHIIKANFGFGDTNSCIILKKW